MLSQCFLNIHILYYITCWACIVSSWGEGILWFEVGLTTVRPPPPLPMRPGESLWCCCCNMARVSGGVSGERPPPRLGRWPPCPWCGPRWPCDWATLRMLSKISRCKGGMLPWAKCWSKTSSVTCPRRKKSCLSEIFWHTEKPKGAFLTKTLELELGTLKPQTILNIFIKRFTSILIMTFITCCQSRLQCPSFRPLEHFRIKWCVKDDAQ